MRHITWFDSISTILPLSFALSFALIFVFHSPLNFFRVSSDKRRGLLDGVIKRRWNRNAKALSDVKALSLFHSSPSSPPPNACVLRLQHNRTAYVFLCEYIVCVCVCALVNTEQNMSKNLKYFLAKLLLKKKVWKDDFSNKWDFVTCKKWHL